MIDWFIRNRHYLLIVLLLVLARLIGGYFSRLASRFSERRTAQVYELRTPDGRRKKIEVGPYENLDAKMAAAIKADKADIEKRRSATRSGRA